MKLLTDAYGNPPKRLESRDFDSDPVAAVAVMAAVVAVASVVAVAAAAAAAAAAVWVVAATMVELVVEEKKTFKTVTLQKD